MKKSPTTTLFLSLALTLSLSLGISSQALAQFSTPAESVQNMLDEVFAILRAPDFDLSRDRQSIDTAVSVAFDTNTIAQSALASNYRELSAEQRAEFEELFFSILKSTYIERLDTYTDESVEVTGEEVDGNRGTVMSLVYTSNSEIAVNYSLRQRTNGWFIYDIVVEDVSLLSSYRSTYRSIIRRSGIDSLLNDIRTQAAGLE
ncbi:MAG: ABC transporter substrate-binding protein [Gammaproteobacteria bacterium]|jgi:phospholipid transport system substrate-binding protein|nr:ABC transporter substrate-binding protein [Gammaproteobacteria bacterium]